jgi:hypothetical protein
MTNAALSTLQQVVTILMAVMGVIVAIRPPKKSSRQEYGVISAFLLLGLIGVSATYVQGKRVDLSSEKQQEQLNVIQKNTEQSQKMIVEQKIDPSVISDAVKSGFRVPRVKSTPRETKGQPQSLATRTFMVSTDVLTFLFDREKGRPRVSWMAGDFGMHSDENLEQFSARLDRESKAYQNYEMETAALFTQRYWPRALQLLIELKSAGLFVEPVWYQPTTVDRVRDFAIGLGNIAEKTS